MNKPIEIKLLDLSPQEFVQFLKERNIYRFFFVYDEKIERLSSSHRLLQPIADFIQTDQRDFMEHEGLFFQLSQRYDTLQGVFVHSTKRGQAIGGVRFWHYDTVEDYIRDGLRLSKGMTRKNSLAGLWWGGGKGVMAMNPSVDKTKKEVLASIYGDFGEMLTSLRGCFVAGEDVGTNVDDIANVFCNTRFTTCIPKVLGGSGNPSILTAKGVICGMKAGLKFTGDDSLKGKTIAVQGMGNVGGALIRFLFEENVRKVIATDIDRELVEHLVHELSHENLEASIVERDDDSILKVSCDILAPCATGAILCPRTIANIKAKIICGSANNQLQDPERDDLLLYEKGIIYIPDFITNRMGIVNCANEQYGFVKDDPFIERHLSTDWVHSIYQTSLNILQSSLTTSEPPAKIAMREADRLSLNTHPIFGHRGRQIIDSLVNNRWHET